MELHVHYSPSKFLSPLNTILKFSNALTMAIVYDQDNDAHPLTVEIEISSPLNAVCRAKLSIHDSLAFIRYLPRESTPVRKLNPLTAYYRALLDGSTRNPTIRAPG